MWGNLNSELFESEDADIRTMNSQTPEVALQERLPLRLHIKG